MSFSIFMFIYAAVTAVFGLPLVVATSEILGFYGMEPDASLLLIPRLLGAVLISLAVLTWLARNLDDSEARQAIVTALLAGEATGFCIAFDAQMRGVFNAMGWSIVFVYLFFSLGLAYFRFSKQQS